MKSKLEQHDSDSWEACPEGELSRLVHRLQTDKSQSRRRVGFAVSFAAAALVAFAVIGVKNFSTSGPPLYGGISCLGCKQNFEAYHKHLTNEEVLADADVLESMRVHLAKCKRCKKFFNRKYPGSLADNYSATRPAIMLALCPQFTATDKLSIH